MSSLCFCSGMSILPTKRVTTFSLAESVLRNNIYPDVLVNNALPVQAGAESAHALLSGAWSRHSPAP